MSHRSARHRVLRICCRVEGRFFRRNGYSCASVSRKRLAPQTSRVSVPSSTSAPEEHRLKIDRREFLMTTGAAGAFALSACATGGGSPIPSATEAAGARRLYEAIFERMLVASPELATHLG